jgi:hypothetical protein
MIKLNQKQISNIAEELQSGMTVYVNINSGNVIAVIDEMESFISDDDFLEEAAIDPWESERMELAANPDSYLKVEKMGSNQEFKIMTSFANSITDKDLKVKLDLALGLSKPFRNFKDIIDMEKDERQRWLSFKQAKYEDFIREQIEQYNDYISEDR